MGLSKTDYLITDRNYRRTCMGGSLGGSVVNGEAKGRGLLPRDYSKHPPGSLPGVGSFRDTNIDIIPKSEWSARIREMEETKSRLSDLRFSTNDGKGFTSLDQNGQGFCWAYSTTVGVMYVRAAMNQPFVRLSAHSVACKIKNFRDEGGWGAHSQEFISEHGVAPVSHWPEKSMRREHDNDMTWKEARKYRLVEQWAELGDEVWDRDLTFEQVATCLLLRIPVVSDFNWWGHSVLAVDLVEIESNHFGLRIQNSWADSWGDRGLGVLEEGKSRPDGATAIRTALAS